MKCRFIPLFLYCVLINIGSMLLVQTSSAASFPLSASSTIINQWTTGYQVEVTVKNNTPNPTQSWQAQFTLPTGEKITSFWNGVYTANGNTITVNNPTWVGGGVIPGNSSTTFGMVISMPTNGVVGISNVTATANGNVTPPPPVTPPSTSSYIIDSYWESWNSQDSVNTIANMKVDVINISFANFATIGTHQYQISGVEADSATIQQLVNAAHALQKKVRLAVGGATYPLSYQLGTDADAVGMAQAVAQYVTNNNLDGVDYDIEDYPAVALQISLLKNTRQLLPNKIISYTAKSPASTTYPYDAVIQGGYQYVDYISIMAYDYAPGYTYQNDVQTLLGMGIPASKIVIGLMPGLDDVGVTTTLANITTAANYIKTYNLKGIMFWDLNRDLENLTGLGASQATNTAWNIFHS